MLIYPNNKIFFKKIKNIKMLKNIISIIFLDNYLRQL